MKRSKQAVKDIVKSNQARVNSKGGHTKRAVAPKKPSGLSNNKHKKM